jgi:hypothetical protein
LITEGGKAESLDLTYDGVGGKYRSTLAPKVVYSTNELFGLAKKGEFTGTFTGRHGEDVVSAQPAIWTKGSLHKQRGAQLFPRINQSRKVMKISGRHILTDATLFVNGRRVEGRIKKLATDIIEVSLDQVPPRGMNMLQVHNPESYLSNELIFYVESREEAIQRYRKEPAYLLTTILNSAIINDNPEEARILIDAGADLNMPHEHFEKERPPILIASQYGQGWLVDELLRKGADVNIKDKHGNTALHEAAKMGHLEICRKLIGAGARKGVVNDKNKRPSDQTSFFMSKKNFDRYHARNHANLKLDHQRYLRDRVKVLALLRP